MSAYKFINPLMGVPQPGDTGTFGTQPGSGAPFPFGLIQEAVDPTLGYAEFMFVKGGAASAPARGDACLIVNNAVQQIVSGNTASQGQVGIAAGAISASNVWGWAQVYGVCDYAKLGTQGTGAVGLPLCIGTTAGRLQTTASVSTGFWINAVKVGNYSTTANSDAATIQLAWPCYERGL